MKNKLYRFKNLNNYPIAIYANMRITHWIKDKEIIIVLNTMSIPLVDRKIYKILYKNTIGMIMLDNDVDALIPIENEQ